MRSVETRRAQIRVANAGYSALIPPEGTLRHVTRFAGAEARLFDVPIVTAQTPLRVRWGDWFGPTSLAIGLAWLAIARRADRT